MVGKISSITKNSIIYIVSIPLALIFFYPIYLTVAMSMPVVFDIGGQNIKEYEKLLCGILWHTPEHTDTCNSGYVEGLGNKLFISLVSTIITLPLGYLAAYALARFRFPGAHLILLLILVIYTIPTVSLLTPLTHIWTFQFGLDATYFGIILLYTAMNLPIVIVILWIFICQVPQKLEDMARTDGANTLQIFSRVIFPVTFPGLAVATIFTFRTAWYEAILTSGIFGRLIKIPLADTPLTIPGFITVSETSWSLMMANGVLLSIPPFILTLIIAKSLIIGRERQGI